MVRRIARRRTGCLTGDVLLFSADSQRVARNAFYDALADAAPHILEELAELCLPVLKMTPTACLAFAPPGKMSAVAPLGPAVTEWASRHELSTPWLVDDAIWSLLDLDDQLAAGAGGELRLLAGLGGDYEGDYEVGPGSMTGTVTLNFAWHYIQQPRTIIRACMLENLTLQLDAELDRIEAEARAAGGERITRPALARHMRWLVQRVVLRQGEQWIAVDDATGEPVSRRAVEMAIREAADLIALPIPKRKSGRPGTRRPARITANPRR